MVAVVGVHGIAQQYKGPHHLVATWLPSLQDGVHFAGGKLAAANFAMAFYGNLFRKPGTMSTTATGFPPLSATDLDDDDTELLDLWWREAARVDPAVPGPDDTTMVRTPKAAQRALNALSQSSFFAGAAERIMVGVVKQVRLYFSDAQVRAAAVGSVEDAVTADTRVLIGHSLGSVVAYEALAAHPEWKVHTLVTLGSPLGISNLVFDKLKPSPTDGRGAFPECASAWVNVASPGDVVALVKTLADRFDGAVSDHLVDNGAKAHDASPYLTTIEVGQAVVQAIG
jgi:PGAP1-like protein